MRPLSFIFGVLLALGGLAEIAFAYALSSSSACGYALSCTGSHGAVGFGGFRLIFGAVLLVMGIVLIAMSFRPRGWGGGSRGPRGWRRGMYGPGGEAFGPGRMGPMGPPLVCSTCGGHNGPHFQYCRYCGAALAGSLQRPGGPPPPRF